MLDGTIQMSAQGGKQLSVLRFKSDTINLDQFSGPTRFTLSQLAALGVRRVSIGTSFIRTALAAVHRAAREVLDHGTFDYLEGVPGVAAFNDLICPRQ